MCCTSSHNREVLAVASHAFPRLAIARADGGGPAGEVCGCSKRIHGRLAAYQYLAHCRAGEGRLSARDRHEPAQPTKGQQSRGVYLLMTAGTVLPAQRRAMPAKGVPVERAQRGAVCAP